MKLSLTQFKGNAPKIDPALLPDGMSQRARSVDISSGILLPEKEDLYIDTVATDTKSIYKYYKEDGTSAWYTWNKKVKVIKDFVYSDMYNRIIIQGADEELLITDSTLLNASELRTIDRTNAYVLGIPRLDKFTMAVSGSSTGDVTESRSYIVALVREWSDGKIDIGGLSAPAETSDGSLTIDVKEGQLVSLTDINVPVDTITSTGCTKLYIYRSEIGTTTTGYSYVDSIDLGLNSVYSYTDSKTSEQLGEGAVSQTWDNPVSGLKGLMTLNNGVIAAYKDQTVYFSYPYQPYSFPASYTVNIDSAIVGLGAFGNTVVVCTKANPIMILVADPAAPTVTPIQRAIPCLNEGSIANTSSGVLYVTPSGTALIDSYSYELVTKDIVSSNTFKGINLEGMSSVVYNDEYIVSLGDNSREFGYRLDLENINNGVVTFSENYSHLWLDEIDNSLYALKRVGATLPDTARSIVTTPLHLVEVNAVDNQYKNFTWKSKYYISTSGILTLSAVRIDADYEFPSEKIIIEDTYNPINGALAVNYVNEYTLNATVNNSKYKDAYNVNNLVAFTYMVDGKVKYQKYCSDAKPFRLPSGFRGRRIEIQIDSKIPVRQIDLASSIGELS